TRDAPPRQPSPPLPLEPGRAREVGRSALPHVPSRGRRRARRRARRRTARTGIRSRTARRGGGGRMRSDAVWYVVDANGERHGEYDSEVAAAAKALQLTVLALGRKGTARLRRGEIKAATYRVVPAVRWRSRP